MGNGRKSGLFKGLKNNVKNNNDTLAQKLQKLKVRAKSTGYDFETASATTDGQVEAMNKWFGELERYQKAMEEDTDTINGAGGYVTIQNLRAGVMGDSSADGTIRMATAYVEDSTNRDTLPHEHTHNLMDYLIEKEMGFARESTLFNAARMDGTIYKSVNENALIEWKNNEIKQLEKSIQLLNNKNERASKLQALNLQERLNEVNTIDTPFKAAKYSGMRSYAQKVYSYESGDGAGFEIPTVAAEKFVQLNYNWNDFKRNGGYAYYVLKELKHRIHK